MIDFNNKINECKELLLNIYEIFRDFKYTNTLSNNVNENEYINKINEMIKNFINSYEFFTNNNIYEKENIESFEKLYEELISKDNFRLISFENHQKIMQKILIPYLYMLDTISYEKEYMFDMFLNIYRNIERLANGSNNEAKLLLNEVNKLNENDFLELPKRISNVVELSNIVEDAEKCRINNFECNFDKYFMWLYKNEDIRDSELYLCVELLCSYYYFELEEYSKKYFELDDINGRNKKLMYGKRDVRIDYIFNRALNALEKVNMMTINNLDIPTNIKKILKRIISKSEFYCYIGEGISYNFKEAIIRKYMLYYIDRGLKKNKDKIIGAFKQSSLYSLLEKGINLFKNNTNINAKCYFYEQICFEVSMNIYDFPCAVREEELLKNKYYIHNTLKSALGNIFRKNYFDDFIFKFLDWICVNDIQEFKEHKNILFEYLNECKSDYEEYESNLEMLTYKNQLVLSLNEKGYGFDQLNKLLEVDLHKDFSADVLKNLEREINELYDIDMLCLKKQNETWYSFLIHGQYYYNIIKQSEYLEDYCGPVLYWCKCVETMIYDKIYLKIMNNRNIVINRRKEHALGTIPYLCGIYDNDKDLDLRKKEKYNRQSKEIENTIKWSQKINNYKFNDFARKIYELNDKYRISCAHTKPILFDDAEACRELIFTSAKIIQVLMKL